MLFYILCNLCFIPGIYSVEHPEDDHTSDRNTYVLTNKDRYNNFMKVHIFGLPLMTIVPEVSKITYFISARDGGQGSTLCLEPLHVEKTFRYALNRRLDWFRNGLELFWRENNLLPMSEIET